MAFNYANLRDNTAAPAIAEFGQGATLRANASAYDPATGGNTLTPTDTSVTVVETETIDKVSEGSLLEMGDRKFLMSTEGVTTPPKPTDVLIVNSAEYQVVQVQPLAPGGTTVLYTVWGRG